MSLDIALVVQECADRYMSESEGTPEARTAAHTLVVAAVAANMAIDPHWSTDMVVNDIFHNTPESRNRRMAIRRAAAHLDTVGKSSLRMPEQLLEAIANGQIIPR